MTLFTAINARPRRSRHGFTLVEMLVVIGIIVVLIGILMPALNLAYSHSVRNRMQMDIQAITIALEQYRSDQRAYPQLNYNDTTGIMTANYPGAVLLWWSIVGGGYITYDTTPPTPHGSGFQTIQRGQVYGPYIGADRVKLVQDPGMTALTTSPWGSGKNFYFIADRYGHPILYFLANNSANPASPNGFVASLNPATTPGTPAPRYNLADNSSTTANPFTWPTDPAGSTTNALIRMRLMLGDVNANGQLDPGETPATNAAFLLWSAGPDEMFGVDLSKGTAGAALATAATYVPNCDDANNFKQ